MRNHGSQHWRKPHGIRYDDYDRNNSLIRTTLSGISLHALSSRLVQRTHVELSIYWRKEKPVSETCFYIRKLLVICIRLASPRFCLTLRSHLLTQDKNIAFAAGHQKATEVSEGVTRYRMPVRRVSRLWRLDRIDRGLPLTDSFVQAKWILSRP